MHFKDLDKVSRIELKKSILEMTDYLYENHKGFTEWWDSLDRDSEEIIESELFKLMDKRFNKHRYE